ncbi:bifunctional diaminohydroxyphosphoribosylaminopyrimidine deaminase/5-amino-6-(5-phosphoribosylamino)uracil reductase RibD [Hoeflea sp. YIM 152468]|uniref:bifunctional diaminohydroxyphosphoribosylaminopyrimidine deaminase/5-amino-6-(5-phosphoribosylamino)uracil reductase RibD n=1 Tax=Hoeflea sp. YIM 152468 TaxID=3031759 RepID=UPI0023DC9510|nr:bifunctional diaminohydroxyphosphoribosylaminopyrimidine deaminase/5-amino-6-(5-phosphoribosylamino)uracil reductase RibD [Hoeflea sp. YIM 152468]MDF1607153.1 bifunctional diaminohydroxyphosphoribosylaminopyrimidine deaminase/5-amino-6-(5-phosphoribosylamino)uracil reductase RibD [Hoeflea sp. YIM 152468]
MAVSALDRRFIAAAIRLARWHQGRTGSNPSVATLIVNRIDGVPVIVGRGITAIGGRPHAEAQALAEAGALARGATAYVTLEPCAHHGRTPPCAEALVTAGIARVVAAATDPDERVSGRGYAILRTAGIEVETGVLAREAERDLAGYLTRRINNRVHVTLKLAVSSNGKIGKRDAGQVAITGEITRRQVHALRALSDVILIGVGTAINDDPELTCRLPGLEDRSPVRLVLDTNLRLSVGSRLAATARTVPLWIATAASQEDPRRAALADCGAEFVASDALDGRLALPELLEDLAARGLSTVLVEGGAGIARSFLAEDLVDRIVLLTGEGAIAGEAVDAPVTCDSVPPSFRHVVSVKYGADQCDEYERV